MFLKRKVTVLSLTGNFLLLEINVIIMQTTTVHTSGSTHASTLLLLVLQMGNNTKYPIRDDQKIIRNDHLENKSDRNSEAAGTQGAWKSVGGRPYFGPKESKIMSQANRNVFSLFDVFSLRELQNNLRAYINNQFSAHSRCLNT